MSPSVISTILIALIMLLGTEGDDYLIFERAVEEWQVVDWLHRN